MASQFNTIYLNFSTAISGVLLPKISKMVANGEGDKEISDLFIKTGRLQYLIMGLVITGFVLFGKSFIILLFGNDYETSYYIACILMIPVTIPLIQNVAISILQAKNMHKFRSILYICMAAINIIISIPLARLYGGIGSAIGTSISLILGNGITMNIYYHKKAGLNIISFWKQILIMTIPISIIFFASLFILMKINTINWLVLILGIIIYSIIYSIISFFFMMNNYERKLIFNPINKILKNI